eukprot:CAMPEP_0113943314 /NCGR_PEP_ID=MMETSP1339-20121228/23178_1 /TAXON_ID=94617 /ORGANISM="Fibrocapsa japonica" /LENGTH=272 /DNA_ID=CAMNT_0000948155 /DNA_START=127 /DNA_END=945 /DNA_ORIENTATION=- /assembly_acc=CAM_ASM_000762
MATLFLTAGCCLAFAPPTRHMLSAKVTKVPLKTMLMSSRADKELDSIRLDESKLPKEEQERLKNLRMIEKNLAEVEQIERQLGMSQQWNFEDEEEEEEIPIEKTQWSGQAGLDVSEPGNRNWSDLATRPLLTLGDMATLVLFSYIGRASHGNPQVDWGLLGTAAPFLAGWLLLAPLAGAYTRQAVTDQGSSAKSVAVAWVASIPAGIFARALTKGGEIPPTSFIAVSMTATLVLLLTWRAIFVKVNGSPDKEFRDGGIIDGFRMITTLIKRW